MKAVHFGAGNIGRGFIGSLLHQSGYQITFLDVNEELVSKINQLQEYQVETVEDQPQTIRVRNIKAINSKSNQQQAIDAIAEADLITTAVGPHVLPFIAPLLAEGLKQRLDQNPHFLQVIACENMLNSSQELKKHVLSLCSPEQQKQINTWIGFPNAVVDRIVPTQPNQDSLSVKVEPYFEWVVDQHEIKGEKPPLSSIHLVDSFDDYVSRKLFTVNTAHVVAAYLGYQAGWITIAEAMEHSEIASLVKGCLAETRHLLIHEHGFSPTELDPYIDQIPTRFQNPYLKDQVTRVARSPMRKLGRQERLILPALRLLDIGIRPVNLASGITAALNYDWSEDQEAVQLQAAIQQKGPIHVLAQLAQLDIQHPLIQLIGTKVDH